MFPTPTSRFRTAFRRSLDAAIEFATLGEYGYAAAWEGAQGDEPTRPGDPGALDARSTPAVRDRPEPELLRPASAAGRARRNADTRGTPRCAGQHLRGRALEPKLPRAARSRDGMAPRDPRRTADCA